MREPIRLADGVSHVEIYVDEYPGASITRLKSNLHDKDGADDGDTEAKEYNLVVDGVEMTLLALFETGALHKMTDEERKEFFLTITDALSNWS